MLTTFLALLSIPHIQKLNNAQEVSKSNQATAYHLPIDPMLCSITDTKVNAPMKFTTYPKSKPGKDGVSRATTRSMLDCGLSQTISHIIHG